MVHKEFMSKSRLKAYEAMENHVVQLNNTFKVGETVSVRNDDGNYDTDIITSPFQIMSGQIVAWLENKRCYMAERVRKP